MVHLEFYSVIQKASGHNTFHNPTGPSIRKTKVMKTFLNKFSVQSIIPLFHIKFDGHKPLFSTFFREGVKNSMNYKNNSMNAPWRGEIVVCRTCFKSICQNFLRWFYMRYWNDLYAYNDWHYLGSHFLEWQWFMSDLVLLTYALN